MNKKIFLSLLFVLILAVSCNRNKVTEPTTTIITFEDFQNEISGLYNLNLAEYGTIKLDHINFTTSEKPNYFKVSATGESGGTTSSTSVETVQKTINYYLNQMENSKINYQVITSDKPTYPEQPISFTIIMTPKNNEFNIDSFKTKGFTDTVNTTDSKITFTIEITPNNFIWNNSIT
ncbi:unnamed protein product [Brachyspira suanatina]|uniref:Uncharacterized protein n=1 Tax=Brachyspira suanatina TaxID=381802 RepID=A0A0G4K3G5_9SPIR|nr:hypothetical protein [Brachyspira suanatina]CRF31420.1 unnamed protein product [Brachyspira suanatina]